MTFDPLPPRLQAMTFETFITEHSDEDVSHNLMRAVNLARSFARHPSDMIVYLGEPGCGKTHLAAAIINEVAAREEPCCFAFVPDMLDTLRATLDERIGDDGYQDGPINLGYRDLMYAIRTAPLLVLDSLGSHYATQWTEEKLFQIIDYRQTHNLPTVITTNVPLEQLTPDICGRLLNQQISTVFAIIAPTFGAIFQHRRPRSRRD